MANQQHLDILKQGVDVWNKWRKEHPDIQPDLSEAHLERVHLRKAHLEGVKFSTEDGRYSDGSYNGAHLEGADLREAHLEGADLQGTHLEGADLREAHLEGASTPPADLRGAFFNTATKLDYIIVSDDKGLGIGLADLHWGDVNLSVVDWAQVKVLRDEIEAGRWKSHHAFWPIVEKGFTETDAYEAAVRANRQLAMVLQGQGLNEVATRFAYRAQKLSRKVLWRQVFQRTVWKRRQQHKIEMQKVRIWQRMQRLGAYLFLLFIDILAGYGYRPGRALIWYLLVLLGFTTAYSLSGNIPFFPDALVFSIMSFHGRGFFPSLSGETSLHNPLVVLAAAEAVIGLFIEISFIATFTQRYFGK